MAIGTDATIHFFGTQDPAQVVGGTSAVADGAFSASGDVVSGGWTNDDDAPWIAAVLTLDAASAPAAGKTVDLFARPMNIDGTGDAPQTDTNYVGSLIGAFLIDVDAASHSVALIGGFAPLPNHYTSQVFEFYIRNNTGVSIDAGWTLKITPITDGPHA